MNSNYSSWALTPGRRFLKASRSPKHSVYTASHRQVSWGAHRQQLLAGAPAALPRGPGPQRGGGGSLLPMKHPGNLLDPPTPAHQAPGQAGHGRGHWTRPLNTEGPVGWPLRLATGERRASTARKEVSAKAGPAYHTLRPSSAPEPPFPPSAPFLLRQSKRVRLSANPEGSALCPKAPLRARSPSMFSCSRWRFFSQTLYNVMYSHCTSVYLFVHCGKYGKCKKRRR